MRTNGFLQHAPKELKPLIKRGENQYNESKEIKIKKERGNDKEREGDE